MSHEATTWAYRQNIAASDGKSVLVALADMADEAHSCYPGQAKLAQMTGHAERTVRRQLAQLELAGYIKRERRFDKLGRRTSDRYVLPVDADVLPIPTGQNDRSYGPPANSATGQDDRRSNESIPTGQSGQVTVSRTINTPQPPASGGRRRSHCPKHSRHNSKCSECVRLDDRDLREATWPPWCGTCDEHTRKRADELRSRCLNCHPLSIAKDVS